MKTYLNLPILVLAVLSATAAHARVHNLCYLTNSEPDYGKNSGCSITLWSDVNADIIDYNYSCSRNLSPAFDDAKVAAELCTKSITWYENGLGDIFPHFDDSVVVTIGGKTMNCRDTGNDFKWVDSNGEDADPSWLRPGDTLQADPTQFTGTVSTSLAQKNVKLAQARTKANELKASGYCEDVIDNTDFSNEVGSSKK